MRAHVDRGFEGLWLKSDHLHSSWWDPILEQATRGLQGSCSSQSIPTEVSMLIQGKAKVPPRCLRVMAAASTLSSGQPCKHKYKQSTTGCGMTQDRADHVVTLLWPCRVDNGWFYPVSCPGNRPPVDWTQAITAEPTLGISLPSVCSSVLLTLYLLTIF